MSTVYLSKEIKSMLASIKNHYEFDSIDKEISDIHLIERYLKLGIEKKIEEKNRNHLDDYLDEIRDIMDLFLMTQGAVMQGIKEGKIDEEKWVKYKKLVKNAFDNVTNRG